MNVAVVILLVALAQQSDDPTALVEASKEAKAKRKTSTTKVITNADVARTKGKVVQRKGVPVKVTRPATLMEKYEAERKERLEREAKLKTLDETIAVLSREVARLEQSYYEENDFEIRDGEIARRFAETKTKLDAALAERAALTPTTE